MELFVKILTNVFGNATIILGLVALFGCLLLRRKWTDTLLAVIKTMMGYEIVSAGAGLMGTAMTPLIKYIYRVLNAQGFVQNTWPAYSASMAAYGTQIAIVFLIGFVLNMLLVRFTKLKGIALTVHLMLFVASAMVPMCMATGANPTLVVIVCGIAAGLYYWLVTTYNAKLMRSLDMGDEYTIFVFCWWGFLLSKLLKKVFRKDTDIDEIKFPSSLMWLKDINGVLTVVMFLLYMGFGLVAGVDYMQELAGDQFWWVSTLLNSIQFAMSISIVLFGVRMLIAELVPAFAGITEKLLPDAVPGLDYPTVFQFSPSAVMFGFVFNMVGSLLATVVMIVVGMPVIIIPGIQGQFFEGAVVGVFANRIGGTKNVIVSNLLYGFITMFVLALCVNANPIWPMVGGFYENCDYCVLGLALSKMFALVS